MNTWPISTRAHGEHLLLGIPPRLGDGSPGSRPDWPALEQRAGEEWLEQVLRVIMPAERTWLWWTRNDVFQQTKLSAERAPALVDPAATHSVLRRNLWLRHMSLIVVPPNCSPARDAVVRWAGADTEQLPDHLWTAQSDASEWRLDDVITWCGEPRAWNDPERAVRQPAERVVTLFGGYVFCALRAEAGERLLRELEALAGQWGLVVIPGDERDAWAGSGPVE